MRPDRRAIRWDDPELRIDWPIVDTVIVSEQDGNGPDMTVETHT
jgi:dTDP-4-dehydrorhamnose 3,5-epimerase-like enzyme